MKNKRINKMFYTTLAATVIVGSGFVISPVSAAETTSFIDVKEGHSHYQGIMELVKKGAIKGYEDGTFKPSNSLTRGQAATILAKVLNLNTTSVKDPGFSDVSKNDEFYGAIAALKDANIINGYSDNTFKPYQPITRGQMATILVNAFDLKQDLDKNLPFEDVTSEESHATNIKRLYDNGITVGTTAKTYSPSNNLSRGQAATLIYRAMNVQAIDTFELSIMHTNDTHGYVEMAPKRATAVKEIRAEKPDALLLDAGDVNTGTLYYNEFLGLADMAFMNYMGYDAMTFGNHEFDQGSSPDGHKALVDFIKAAEFPFVSANVNFSGDAKFTGLFTDLISSEPDKGKIYNGIVKEINGEKVGIFGLTTTDTKNISSPGSIVFENYIEEAEKAVKAFEGMGVDKIVAISHLGYDDDATVDNDLELAKSVEGIDIIVGGHSHTQLNQPVLIDTDKAGKEKDATLIVQAKEYSAFLGTLDVSFDENGVVVDFDGELVDLGDYEDDETALEILKPYKDQVEAVEKQEIGVTLTQALANPRTSDEGNDEKLSVRKNETILGNLITDGMLTKAKEYTDKEVIMAFQNGGGIRASIDEGPITVAEVITVLPYGNTLALMDVTGAELKAAFEISVGKYPNENGGFLHVAGAKVEFDSSKPSKSRVVSIQYKDASGNYVEIKDNETYTVATNAFTAKGGDGYDVFKKVYEEGRVKDLGLSDWVNLQEHLQSLKSIPTTTEGRIVDIAAK